MRIEGLGGLSPQLLVHHASGHLAGCCHRARGNRWADHAARRGRDLHSVSNETGPPVKPGLKV
eukprot:1051191-Pyramimonas_sp.AAC.1